MRRFREILAEFSDHDEATALGGRATSTLTEKRRAELRNRLDGVIRRNALAFWLAVAMTVGLFVAFLLAVFLPLPSLATNKAFASAFGGVSAMLIYRMTTLWREKTATELLLELATSLEGPALTTVLRVLADSNRIRR